MEAMLDQQQSKSKHLDDLSTLPKTLYREHIEACGKPENAFTFDFMCDYLTMMDTLAKSMTRTLEEVCSLTLLQYRILIRLLDRPYRTSELADILQVRTSTISTAIAKLASRRLITRQEDPSDMRVVDLEISRAGRTMIARADEALESVISTYWNSLSQEQLRAAMESSISAVERHSIPRFDEGTLRIDTALLETVAISRSLTSHCLEREGLTTNDYRIMLALKVMGSSCCGADIAKFLFLNSCDITSSLKNLEALRYITRKRDQRNRRMRPITLTPLGETRTSELLPPVFDALHETCHSNDELIRIHISSARDLVARKRHRSEF